MGEWKDLDVSGFDINLNDRLTILEEQYELVEYYYTVTSGTTGTVSIPTGYTIEMDRFTNGIDAIVAKEGTDGKPTDEAVYTSLGVIISTTLAANGAYVFSGIPSGYNVCIVYYLKGQRKYRNNLVFNNILGSTEYNPNPTIETVRFGINPTVVAQTGLTYWDATDKTLATTLDATAGVILQHGQEIHIRCVNKSGVDIDNGKVVYIFDAQGNRPSIKLARADSFSTACIIGVTTQSITNNNEGYVTVFGIVRDVNTSTFSDGGTLYLSTSSAGEMTITAPTSPNFIVTIGKSLNTTNSGSIFVHPDMPLSTDGTLGGDSNLYAITEKAAKTYSVTGSGTTNKVPKFTATKTLGNSNIEDTGTVVKIPVVTNIGDGGTTNYSQFESTGFVKHVGSSKYWVDIDFPIIVRTTGIGIPVLTTFNGNLTMPLWAVNDFNQCESQEFIHAWEEGSTCYWHLHLNTNGSDINNRYVRFELEYGYTDSNSTWTFPPVVTTADLLIPANTPTKTQIVMPLANFTPTGTKIGGHSIARLKRVASVGTAPTNNPWIPMLQLHILCDTGGSRNMTSK
jgi:hypothetical protein